MPPLFGHFSRITDGDYPNEVQRLGCVIWCKRCVKKQKSACINYFGIRVADVPHLFPETWSAYDDASWPPPSWPYPKTLLPSMREENNWVWRVSAIPGDSVLKYKCKGPKKGPFIIRIRVELAAIARGAVLFCIRHLINTSLSYHDLLFNSGSRVWAHETLNTQCSLTIRPSSCFALLLDYSSLLARWTLPRAYRKSRTGKKKIQDIFRYSLYMPRPTMMLSIRSLMIMARLQLVRMCSAFCLWRPSSSTSYKARKSPTGFDFPLWYVASVSRKRHKHIRWC